MKFRSEVNLPRSHVPLFPDRCVFCREPGPGEAMRFTTGTIAWWTVVVAAYAFPFSVTVPACGPCRRRSRLEWWGLLAFVSGAIFVSMLAMFPFRNAIPPLARRLIAVAVGLFAGATYGLYRASRLQPFDVTAFPRRVDYEFIDHGDAVEFAAPNSDAAWVKIEEN
jgi:hypothetical protein